MRTTRGGILMYGVAAVLVLVAATVATLLAMSPGTVRPVSGPSRRPIAGSLAEKVRVSINGAEQGMFIRSVDPTNPVLLIMHGGPGMPEYFLDGVMPTGLENDFTVVWWDQRGAGLSFRAGDSAPESMTVDVLVEDTIAVADHLRKRFGQSKVYLLAHSWGSYVGALAAERAPDRFHAYIAVGQVTHQLESEKAAYEYALAEYRTRGDRDMLRKLESSPVIPGAPLPPRWNAMRDEVMHRLGVGTTREMRSVVTGVFLPSWKCPEYTLPEKVDLWRGKFASRPIFWDRFMNVDMRQTVPRLSIPAYFLHGRYDYTTSYDLARDYFAKLDAPVKGFYTFEDSAHSPLFEEPERMRQILSEDVLNGVTTSADPR